MEVKLSIWLISLIICVIGAYRLGRYGEVMSGILIFSMGFVPVMNSVLTVCIVWYYVVKWFTKFIIWANRKFRKY